MKETAHSVFIKPIGKFTLSRLYLDGLLLCLLATVWGTPLAQESLADPVSDSLYALHELTEDRGDTPAEKADEFAAWMAANDWQSMDILALYNLYGMVNADSVDRTRFSARWTGSLTAPVSATYTLRQVPVYHGTNSRLKVSIDGQVVLDSTADAPSSESFVSSPVQLTAGQAVSFQVEMSHDDPYINFSESAPMVLLTWQRNGGSEEIIPSSAFTPPPEFAPAGEHGLKGEYFGTTDYQDLRITRLDPALDLVWSWPPAASIHHEEAQQVFDACTAKILDGDFLSQAVAEDNLVVLDRNLWRIAYRMRASERQQLIETLRQRPDVQAAITPEVMGRLMQACYMLPSDDHVDLVGEWSFIRPRPRCQAGKLPGWGDDYYRKLNTDFYWLIGQFMQGAYWDDAERMCDLYLEHANGECNLTIAYAAAYAAHANDTSTEFLDRLTAKIEDPAVLGNTLVTWLIARAFAAGVMRPTIEPMGGYSDLESAYVAAESDEYKLWTLQEMVARLSSVDKGVRAKQLIEERRGQFSDQDQQAMLDGWVAKADELAAYYVQERVSQEEAAQTAYVNELQRRRQAAIDTGDDSAVSRYTSLISSAQNGSP